MKLLVISNNPQRASFRQRIEVYLDALAAAGIEPDVARLGQGGERRALWARASAYDAVLLHKKTLNWLDGPRLRRRARCVIYDFDDAVMYSPHHPERKSFSHASPFRRTAALADCVIAGNAYLGEHASRFNGCVEVLGTGLDTAAYRVDARRDGDTIRLVWIGSASTLGYLKAVSPALNAIGRSHRNVVLRIICDAFFDLTDMPVEKVLWSAEGQFEALTQGDIGLAPLPDNPFTRGKCGFKILQYAAAGLPTVASPVGVNTEFIGDGQRGCCAVSQADWVQAIDGLVRDESLRRRMGRAAGQWVRRFDHAVLAGRFVELVKRAMDASARA